MGFAGEDVLAPADFREGEILSLHGAFAAEDDQGDLVVAGIGRIGVSFFQREDAEGGEFHSECVIPEDRIVSVLQFLPESDKQFFHFITSLVEYSRF